MISSFNLKANVFFFKTPLKNGGVLTALLLEGVSALVTLATAKRLDRKSVV